MFCWVSRDILFSPGMKHQLKSNLSLGRRKKTTFTVMRLCSRLWQKKNSSLRDRKRYPIAMMILPMSPLKWMPWMVLLKKSTANAIKMSYIMTQFWYPGIYIYFMINSLTLRPFGHISNSLQGQFDVYCTYTVHLEFDICYCWFMMSFYLSMAMFYGLQWEQRRYSSESSLGTREPSFIVLNKWPTTPSNGWPAASSSRGERIHSSPVWCEATQEKQGRDGQGYGGADWIP